MFRLIVGFILSTALGCNDSTTQRCGDLVCSGDRVCAGEPEGCYSAAQVAACDRLTEDSRCEYESVEGRCSMGICVVSVCGDGVIDPGEDCDGEALGPRTCSEFGYYQSEGLQCNDKCRFDTRACAGFCGDQVVDSDFGEICDTAPADGSSCFSIGYDIGTPGCRDTCDVDSGLCTAIGWRTEPSGTTEDLVAVFMVDVSRAFAIGGSTIVEYNGTSWEASETPVVATLHSVFATNTNAWTVGEDVSGNGIVFGNDGSGWQQVDLGPLPPLRSIHGSNDDDVWIYGDGVVMRHDGTTWQPMDLGSIPATAHTISALGGGQVWLVGNDTPGSWRAIRSDGTTQLETASFAFTPRAVTTSAQGRLFLAASNVIGWVDAGEFVPTWTNTGPDVSLTLGATGLVAYSDTELLAYDTDDGVVRHLSGPDWVALDLGSGAPAYSAMHGDRKKQHLLVGAGGVIARYTGASLAAQRPQATAEGIGRNLINTRAGCAAGNHFFRSGQVFLGFNRNVMAHWIGNVGHTVYTDRVAHMTVASEGDDATAFWSDGGIKRLRGTKLETATGFGNCQVEQTPLPLSIAAVDLERVVVSNGCRVSWLSGDQDLFSVEAEVEQTAEPFIAVASLDSTSFLTVTASAVLLGQPNQGSINLTVQAPTPTFAGSITAFWAASAQDYYLGSDEGDIWRYHQAQWSLVAKRAGNPVVQLAGSAADDVFALFREDSSTSVLLNYDGIKWSPVRVAGQGTSLCVSSTAISMFDSVDKQFVEIQRRRVL